MLEINNITLIFLLGQTCSGKSQMAVDLAKYLGKCWIVGCDSRQIYKGLDIGTAKVEGDWQVVDEERFRTREVYFYQNIPHFLIDYINPKIDYSLLDYLQDFQKLVQNCQKISLNYQPKYLIVTGGTGLYARAIDQQYSLYEIKKEFQNDFKKYQIKLKNMDLKELNNLIEEERISLQHLNSSDRQNSRRLQSLILKNKLFKMEWGREFLGLKFAQSYKFAISIDSKILQKRIQERIDLRIQNGLLKEAEKQMQILGTERLLNLGLEYRLSALFLNQKIDEKTWRERLFIENRQYAKRQLTWLKKEEDLVWIKNLSELLKILS